jgi:hypothetical protein
MRARRDRRRYVPLDLQEPARATPRLTSQGCVGIVLNYTFAPPVPPARR